MNALWLGLAVLIFLCGSLLYWRYYAVIAMKRRARQQQQQRMQREMAREKMEEDLPSLSEDPAQALAQMETPESGEARQD